MTLRGTANKILLGDCYSQQLGFAECLREGNHLLTNIFNLVMDIVILRDSRIQTPGLIYHHKIKGMAHADNEVLEIRSKNELGKPYKKLRPKANKFMR